MLMWILLCVLAMLGFWFYRNPSWLAPAMKTLTPTSSGSGRWKKFFLIVIVLWEGIFGFFAMSNVPRPAFLNWIPHWGTPTLSTAGFWVLTYWLPVLILWGSVMGTIHLLTKETSWEKDGGVLRLVATIAVGAAFVLAAGSWLFGGSPSTRLASIESLSPDVTHVYVLNSNWTEIADGASGNYARCIHVPDSELSHYQQKVLGSNLTAYRSTQGSFAIRGRLEPGSHCTFDP